ncbi:MAG TPA: cyclic nucleotide-binding domain-containing protein [Verrucomicrobiae bacterium]
MNSPQTGNRYIIWGIDCAPYGPVELPVLVSWIKDGRVVGETWVFQECDEIWRRASEISELQMFFHSKTGTASNVSAAASPSGLKPGMLRRVKILAGLTEEQLERFAQFMELQQVPQWTAIVKQGDHGDTMYLILDGELRVRVMVGDRESILATLTIGEFFGDISLFDHGPRSADVIANSDATVLKISSAAFEKLSKEAPEVAAPFLLAIGKTLTARIRADNKRYTDSVKFSRAAS